MVPPGLPGAQGQAGPPGATGPRGPLGIRSGGVVYIRWGKHSCREGATLVYAGLMAGSNHNRAGGGTTRLCMPKDPEYTLPFIDGVQSYSTLYPVEYQLTIRNHGHDIPCAVCEVPSNELVLMIPDDDLLSSLFH